MNTRYFLFLIFLAFSLAPFASTQAQTLPQFSKTIIDGSLNKANAVFPADLDGDGDLDIISAGTNFDGEIAWYKRGGGVIPVFTKISIDDTTSNPVNLVVIDLDNDGDLDVVAATGIDGSATVDNVFWYENDGQSTPTFTRLTLGMVLGSAYAVDVADLDGDSDLDVVITDNGTTGSAGLGYESVMWFENDGASNPSFAKNTVDNGFRKAEAIKIGDLDGDGDLDIVVGSNDQDDIAWYENNGAANPTFSKNFADENALGVGQIELADINDDGHLDIVFADFVSDYVAWLKNDGAANPTFSEIQIESNYDNASVVTVADIDLDGDLDVVAASRLQDDVVWYESNGLASPTFTKHVIDSVLDQPTSLKVADMDDDGSLDIIGAGFIADDVVWYESDKITVNPRSISLDGTNDFIDIPDEIATVLGDGSNLTMEAWIKPDYQNQTESLAAIFAINSSAFSNKLLLTIDNGISANAGQIRVLDGTGDINSFEVVSSQVPNNEWVHIAYTLSDTTGTLYLDGEEIGQHTQSSDLATTDYWSFGQEYDTGLATGNYAKLNVDEIRIWSSVRTQAEIQENMFQTLSGSETNLVGYWALDETNTLIAYDKSINDNTATLENGASRSSENHPYGTYISGNEGWRMMTAPVSGVSYGELLDTLWTQGFTGADATNGTSNVYTWSESSQAFTSITNATEVLAEGEGFIVYVYDDNDGNTAGVQGGFPKMIQTDSTQKTGSVSPTLSFTSSGTLADDGWNLLGNPYGATIDWDAGSGLTSSNIDASFYVWSDSASSGAGAYLSWNGTTGTFGGGDIAPWQGFWVKANAASPSLTLTDNARNAGGILRKKTPVSQLGFTLKGETLSSGAILMFSDNATLEKDALDAYKLQSLNEDYLSLFTQLEDGTGLDINVLPMELEELLYIPMDFEGSDLSGSFELSWTPKSLPAEMTMVLVDTETGTEIDLTETSSYRFDMESQAKTVKRQHLVSPRQGIVSPKVLKSKTSASGPRFVLTINASTSVGNELTLDLPSSVELEQNYPNPFNPSTTINFAVPERGNVQLAVFDMLGRKVAELLNEPKAAGRYTVNFDASQLASGLYLYRLQIGSSVLTRKMTLIK